MRCTLAPLALAALAAANPMPQAVTSAIAPSSTAPAGCSPNFSGTFEIEVVNITSASRKRDTVLTLTLANGILRDEDNRIGYIASNYQFQFDPVAPQAGAIYTAGWSACSNGSLALGGSAVFYQCLSGTFYNLYDESTGAQCSPITIDIINASGAGTTSAVSQYTDGQPQETPQPTPLCQYTDGQPQETNCAPVTQITDGQPQAPTGAPVTQISDGQPQATTGVPVTQISDGQPQATTGTTGVPVTQISDGQPQATTGVPVTQISDGQPQATTGTPVTQISDGQIQATTGAVVSQTSDGQVQAPTSTPAPYVAGAAKVQGGLIGGVAAALLAVVAL